jgi:hypothetical protein
MPADVMTNKLKNAPASFFFKTFARAPNLMEEQISVRFLHRSKAEDMRHCLQGNGDGAVPKQDYLYSYVCSGSRCLVLLLKMKNNDKARLRVRFPPQPLSLFRG